VKRPLAVITGASSGIGAEFARQLAARGYDLLLIARREDRLRVLAGELAAEHQGTTAVILVADLAVDEDRARVEACVAAAENLAVLVNNAGFGTQGGFAEADLDSQDRMHRLHILATLDLTHAALRNFKARHDQEGDRQAADRKRTGIINVSSVAAFQQAPFNVSYCATKAWINSFTEGLSMELSAQGSSVTVQALCPGFTYSEFHDTMPMNRRTIPAMLWMRASFVVAESLRGFDRGALFVIPGWMYRCLVAAIRITPGPWMRRISIFYARKRRERAQSFSA
jgi:hypothetical protein